MASGECPFSSGFSALVLKFLAFLGIVLILFITFRVVRSLFRGLYTCYLGPALGMTVNFRKMGEWAVITGATDGIGKAYAEELAAKGLNIVLISRTLEKLQVVAGEIEKATNVRTKVIAVDFTGGPEIYEVIRQGLEGLEVGVLVNNVGMSFPYVEYFSLVPEGDKVMDQLIKANCTACTMMMRICLPQMEKRKRGVIINISSLSALYPLPLLSVYSATKIYVDYLSQAVNEEYKSKGIIVQSVLPGFVSTKMSKIRRTSFDVPSPKAYVKAALQTVGIENWTYGYPAHKIRGYLQEFLRDWFPRSFIIYLSIVSLGKTRKGYYKKHGLKDPYCKKPAASEEMDGDKKSS